jgi:hypothetical protein
VSDVRLFTVPSDANQNDVRLYPGVINTALTPERGLLTLTGFAPAVVASALLALGVGSLTLTGYAPTVTTAATPVNVTVTPGAGALALQGYAPTVSADVSASVSPSLGALALTGYAPTVSGDVPQIVGGGGPGNQGQRATPVRRSQAHEWELELQQAARLASIASEMAQSDNRQARRIARKLEDYTGDVKQAESLRRELAKLEAVQREKQFRNEIERQKSQDLQDAARELDAILADDEDALDLLMANYDLEADLLLAVFGIGRLI